jgi:hypothetical protein
MDRFAKQTSRIEDRKNAAARYPKQFTSIVAEWNSPGADDRAWLIYSANYLFRTAGVRWALDPLTMRRRVPETPPINLEHAFDQLQFVLLTHRHADHLDIDLLRSLRHLPIHWVIPEFLLPEVQSAVGLPPDQINIPHPLQPFNLCGIQILPFLGLHFDVTADGKTHGVPAMAYLVEFNGKRWLFPGDTRNYRSDLLPSLGVLDGLFAHLWLGRGCALQDKPPLLDDFCRFYIDLQPKRLILTHLEEFGREAEDYWGERHAEKVISRCKSLSPQLLVAPTYTGDCVIL